MVWKPHVTVAAIIENQQKFLLVEETTAKGIEFNQPAGHLEENESLIAAVIREVQEETAWQFVPEAIVGIQLWRKGPDFPTFLRVCFAGSSHSHNPSQTLDDGIISTHWLTRGEVAARADVLRSPLVLTSIDDYLSGQRFPLSLLKSLLDSQHA